MNTSTQATQRVEISKNRTLLATGRARGGDWQAAATRAYNRVCRAPGTPRRHLALLERQGDGLFTVQFGYRVSGGAVTLDPAVVVSVR